MTSVPGPLLHWIFLRFIRTSKPMVFRKLLREMRPSAQCGKITTLSYPPLLLPVPGWHMPYDSILRLAQRKPRIMLMWFLHSYQWLYFWKQCKLLWNKFQKETVCQSYRWAGKTIVYGLASLKIGFRAPVRVIFLLSTSTTSLLGPPSLPSNKYQSFFFQGVKRPGRETGHWSTSVEFKN
jgi:hypothetical protein